MPVKDLNKGLLAVFLLCSLPRAGTAADIHSQASGPWSQTATWTPAQVPTAADSVTILPAHQVTVDITTATASTTTIRGTLSFSRVVHSSFTLVAGSMTVADGGALDLGTNSSPIPAAVRAHLVLAYGSTPGQYGLFVSTGGRFLVRGSTKTAAVAAISTDDLLTSENTLTLVDDPQTVHRWELGDQITISPTDFAGVELRRITAFPGSNQVQVDSNFTRLHLGTSAIQVANLSRNVIVRSSASTAANAAYIRSLAQSATSFSVSFGEFVHIGGSGGPLHQRSVTLDGPSARAQISSSTFRGGSTGLLLNGASNSVVESNLFYDNAVDGLRLINTSNNAIVGNHMYGNLGGTSTGLLADDHSGTYIAFNEIYSNNYGYYAVATGPNLVYANRVYENGLIGMLNGAGDQFIGNRVFLNPAVGIQLGSGIRMIQNSVYRNSTIGLYANGVGSEALFADGSIGFDADGVSLPNATDVQFEGGGVSQEAVAFRNARVNDSGIATGGFNTEGTYLISYNQSFDTGTVRFWGDRTIVGSTWTLDHAQRLFSSTHTAAILLRGSGHAIDTITSSDASTLTELITVTAIGGGNWRVEGSSSGVLDASFNCPSGPCAFSHAKVGFTLTPGAIATGDFLAFATLAASQDAGQRKRLLFGPSDSSQNRGRSKLIFAPGAGLTLRGSTLPTIIDRLSAGSTYYTIVASGTVTLASAAISNADELGLQLSGSGGVSMSSVTFDLAGQGSSSTSAYITARSLTSAATLDSIAFANSRPNQVMRNVRVTGSDAGLAWTMSGWSGALGGPSFEDDANGRVQWEDGVAVISVSAVNLSSITVSWLSVNATSYALKASTASNITGTVFLSSTSNQTTSLTVHNLAFNTTYFLRLDTGIPSGSTVSAVIQSVTLSTSPEPVNFSGISAAGFTVNWAGNNPAGTRYEVQVSTTIDFSGAISSQALTGTSQAFPGLINNTTYFARVRSVNHAGTPGAYALGAVVTAAGVITISANRLASFWYNSPSTLFNAQGANSYRWRITSNASEVPLLSDPDFNGSAQFFTVPEGSMYFHVLGVGGAGDGQVAHFGPVQIDLTAPVMAPLSAQISNSDNGPILDGGATTGANPRVMWTEPASASPVVGYSVLFSTSASDQPAQVVGTTLFFSNSTLTIPGVNYVKVRAVDLAGNWGAAAGMSFTFTVTPASSGLTLRQNYFNPLRGQCVRLEVRAPESGRLLAEIYNSLEQRVAVMSDQIVPVGIHTVAWCGRNSENQVVATGAYVLRVEAPRHKRNYKVIVVK